MVSPAIIVPKPGGKVRLCIDYRQLNFITIPDQYTITNIEDLINCLSEAGVLSTVDLAKGYYQVAMHPDSIEKTAFVVPLGKYEFTVMPYGCSGAPSFVTGSRKRDHFADFFKIDLLLPKGRVAFEL